MCLKSKHCPSAVCVRARARVCIGTMNKINPSFLLLELHQQLRINGKWLCRWLTGSVPDKEEVWIKDDCSSFTLSPGEEEKKSRFLFFGLDCEGDMTMQTLIAVCDSLWLDSTANMLSQIVIYSFLVLSIFYLKNCHQGVLWLIYCMLFSPPPLFFGITIDRFRRR